MIHGVQKTVRGALAVISADNLGSLALGGFKESCSALRICRHCMTSKADSKTKVRSLCQYSYVTFLKFLEEQFELRNENDHKDHCKLIEADKSGAKSKEFGVNRDSVLNELKYFHVCNGGLLPDIMHDILEGALQYEVKLMLQWMIVSTLLHTG